MIREPKLYDTVFNDDGSFYKVNTRTGECVDTGRHKPIWDTDLVISGKQQAAQKEYKQEQEKRTKRRDYSKKNGNHFFVPRSSSFPDLKPQTVARLVYLFTFANYSEQGSCLMWTQRKQMTTKKLPSVLRLSADTVAAFLQEVCPQYLTLHSDGHIAVTDIAFRRGPLASGITYHRCYNHWIRTLYENLPVRQHQYLGCIFQLLPHINIEYNVLCLNPTEEDSAKIEFMCLGEFCKQAGYNSSHTDRLLKTYQKIRFPVSDSAGTHMERFISIVYDGLNRHNAKIFVNPRILYSGAHSEQVELLGAFSKV